MSECRLRGKDLACDSDGIAPGRWLLQTPIVQLTQKDVGKFFQLPAGKIPEAFQEYYTAAAGRSETVVGKGGCKGLQARCRRSGDPHPSQTSMDP